MSLLPGEIDLSLERTANPFVQTVVSSPWDETASSDVPGINQDVFDEILELVKQVRTTGKSTSLALFGAAGSGKTHLLARLRSHLEKQAGENYELLEQSAVFVGVRLQTTPALIWRHLRRDVAKSLCQVSKQKRMLISRIVELRADLLDDLDDRNLMLCLEAIRDGKHVRDALAWLRGDVLPQIVSDQLRLSSENDDEVAEDRAHYCVRQIAQFIAPVPLVICLDQIEAIQSHSGDDASLVALGRFVSALHDLTKNVLVISCIQSSFKPTLENIVRDADADRMLNQHQGRLSPLTWEQAQSLIEARLGSSNELVSLRPSDAPPSWPLSIDRLKPLFREEGACVARRVLFQCRDLFDEAAKKPKQAQPSQSQALSSAFNQRLEAATKRDRPFEWDETLADGLPLLLDLFHTRPKPSDARGKPLFTNIWYDSPAGPAGIALINQENTTSLANWLKKALDGWQPERLPRLFLMRDSRLGIKSTAKTTRQRLQELTSKGAVFLAPSQEAMAALEALRNLHSDAASGDLSYQGKTIQSEEVESWMREQLDPSLQQLVELLVGGTAQQPKQETERLLLLQEHLTNWHITTPDQVSQGLNLPVQEIIELARCYPAHVGLIEGSPGVLFHLVAPEL